MALMEAQRFPADYDAISAGAPVYTLQVQTSAVLRNNTFAKSGGGFSEADLKLVQDSALAACDAGDGLEDGLINDPRQCTCDPADLQCSGAKTASCLAPAQVTALKAIYEGTKTPKGEWAMLPMSRGGEAGWSMFVGTAGTGEDATGGGAASCCCGTAKAIRARARRARPTMRRRCSPTATRPNNRCATSCCRVSDIAAAARARTRSNGSTCSMPGRKAARRRRK